MANLFEILQDKLITKLSTTPKAVKKSEDLLYLRGSNTFKDSEGNTIEYKPNE